MPRTTSTTVPSYQKALTFAKKAHKGQKRSSGEPYYTHVVAVADILKTIHADDETLVAALLHDTVEDTPVTYQDIRRAFGPTVAKLVEGVTKVEQIEQNIDKRERNMQSIRKIFRTMGKDIRVIFIKLADRLHNMQTLHFTDVDKQLRIARETEEIYCPLADLLGIRPWYQMLSDLSFEALDRKKYDLIEKKYEQIWKKQYGQLNQWVRRLEQYLKSNGYKSASVRLVKRHFKGIYTDTYDQEDMLQNIETFYRVHVAIDNKQNCYECLGYVHTFASPLPHFVDDYIASPKVNGYQALHTTVMSASANPINVTIQTNAMEEQSRFGVAMLYKEKHRAKHIAELPGWVEALTSLEEDTQDLNTFFTMIQSEIFGERCRIHLVGKRKKYIDLPSQASTLDVAYYVNDSLGAHAVSAIVNKHETGLKHLVQDGDKVQIISGKELARTAEDVHYIHTSLAQKLLIDQLSILPKRERRKRGQEMMSRAIDITMDPFFSITWQKVIRERVEANDDVICSIGAGMVDPFIYLEEQSQPEDFFLIDPSCFQNAPHLLPAQSMRYVLHTSLDEFRAGDIVGVQVGPDMIDIVSSQELDKEHNYTREYVALKVDGKNHQHPLYFALRFSFLQEANPLEAIATLQSLLDTPVQLLQFENSSVTLCFHTDRIRTMQIAYEYLFGLPYVSKIFRITPA